MWRRCPPPSPFSSWTSSLLVPSVTWHMAFIYVARVKGERGVQSWSESWSERSVSAVFSSAIFSALLKQLRRLRWWGTSAGFASVFLISHALSCFRHDGIYETTTYCICKNVWNRLFANKICQTYSVTDSRKNNFTQMHSWGHLLKILKDLTSLFNCTCRKIQTLLSTCFHYRSKKTQTDISELSSYWPADMIRHHQTLALSSLSPPAAVWSPLPESRETPNAIISATHLVAASTRPTNTQLWREGKKASALGEMGFFTWQNRIRSPFPRPRLSVTLNEVLLLLDYFPQERQNLPIKSREAVTWLGV